jgi:hypothetical protein
VDVHVARTAKQVILEMMRLQIGDGMRHILLARDERLFPQQRFAAPDSRLALNVRGQVPDQQFGPKR